MMKTIAILSISVLLFACKAEQGSATQPAPTEPNASASLPVNQSSQGRTPMKDTQAPSTNETDLVNSCAGIRFFITRAASGGTALAVEDASGERSSIATPPEMNEYQPVGLGCGVSGADGKSYFVVQYGELEGGCSFCEWFYLYDAQGKQLTSSKKILKEDSGLPEGQQQYPDNDEYESMLGKLKLQHPEIEFVK